MNALAQRSLLIAAIILLAGCYSSDRPSTAGTNTSWLHSCEADAECRAGMVCLAGICTHSCAEPAQTDCGQLAPDALCLPASDQPANSARMCDVICGEHEDCAAAGPDLLCIGGRCREQVLIGTGATEPTSSPSAGPEATEPPAAPTTGLNAFDDDGRIPISDVFRQGGVPRLAFLDGRFAAVWSSPPWDDRATDFAGEQLNMGMIGKGGVEQLWTQKPARAPSHRVLAIAADGRLGALPYPSGSCALEIFQPRLIGAFPATTVPCESDLIALAPVPGTLEWIVAYADAGSIYAGRYDPAAEVWVVPALSVDTRAGARSIAVTIDGDDALVAWDGGEIAETRSRAVRGLAAQRAAAAPELGPSAIVNASTHPDGGYNFAQLDGRLLMIGIDRRALWAASFDDTDEAPARVEIASSGIVDRRPGIAAAPEIGLAGVCFASALPPAGGSLDSSDAVLFALIDSEGRLAAEPRVLADDRATIGGCDVAWSGETFLVAWWEIDHESDPRISAVRGQLINRGW